MTQNNTQPADATVMELYAQKARLLLKGSQELLSSGMTGVTQVAFAFSEDWEGLQKTAVFSNGAVTVDVPEEDWEDMVCTVPQQVLATAGKTLMAGIYGTDGEDRMLPTVWCSLGRVEPGAVPAGVEALPPEAPLWARLQKQLGDVAAANPFVVKVLSMLPRDDGSITLELSRSFEEIQEATQADRPVFLEAFGAVLPLTMLIAGSRAEFTGPVFTAEGGTYYHFCTVPNAGDAVVQTLPVGSADGTKGDPGERGPGILKVTSAPASYTTATNGVNPIKRMALSTIKNQAGVSEVLVGDLIAYSYYQYHIYYMDATYAYMDTYVSIRGAAGSAGKDGADGKDGTDGHTPQKGIDYWTQADQEAIVQQVIAALGTPVFGRVDAQNNIILSGNLAEGTYTLKYEDAEGNVTKIGTLNQAVEPEPTYTNVLPLAINSDGTPYNGGKGWKAQTRLNSSGAESTSNATEIEVTGFIPVKSGDIIYLSGITMNTGAYANQTYMWLYDSSFTPMSGRYRLFSQYSSDAWDTHISQGKIAADSNGNLTMLTIDHNVFYTGSSLADLSNAAYLRISCEKIDDNSIITVNEPSE